MMALPPTIIHDYLKSTPEETFINLKKSGLLKKEYRSKKNEFILECENLTKNFLENDSTQVGPNLSDQIANLTQNYLNETGQYFYRTPKYPSNFRIGSKLKILKIISKIKEIGRMK